ncbi:DUF3574 domain-containing protein [Aquabacterium sp. A7-Y]|uniref:DUF3574 domain-containing protein n=1 Tax=Aquabacterium sp. A7-Y TaxID=1349605 RepID=UPI00223CC66C|nr:DUF3574 domain-containing protein [Aquabacterium sp. A7-Y]MCW7538006.1 DUF3574 domain-containing protein [Aquabacterium sp. A7-Y]
MALAGCTTPGLVGCRTGEQRWINETLYFGTARPGGAVSAEDWQGFVDTAITPRFPQGLTHWPAAGQWRGASGEIERETAHVLALAHPDNATSRAAIDAIVKDYRQFFEQEAVLRVRSPACVSY